MTSGIDIRPAVSQADLEAVFRFRYKIYVEEMNRRQRYADHERRRIEDPLDVFAINLVAWKNSEIIGVIRNNAAADGPLGHYENFYDMKSVGDDHPSRTSITTRLMLVPEHRRGSLAIRLANASYKIGIEKNVRWNFIDCNDYLRDLFGGLGWIAHLPAAEHPEYGLVQRLRLDLFDVEHLTSVASPFLRVFQESQAKIQSPQELPTN